MPMGAIFGDIDDRRIPRPIYLGNGNSYLRIGIAHVSPRNHRGEDFGVVLQESGTGELHKGLEWRSRRFSAAVRRI